MAFEESLKSISRTASGDLSSSQYHAMVVNASGQLAAASATGAMDGLLQNKPDAAGDAATLGIDGVSKAVVGASVTAGDDLAVGSGGKLITATTGDVVVARALADGSGDGSVVAVLITRQHEPLA